VPVFASETVSQLLRALEVEDAGDKGTQMLVTVFEKLAGTTVKGAQPAS
jgi:hypothetical protein